MPRQSLQACALLVLVVAWIFAGTDADGLRAEPVSTENLGLELLGNLELPDGKPLEGASVVLIVHGTLAHHGMELIVALQKQLTSRGLVSLAVTLSLGLNRRTGMYDCAIEHDHRHSDAPEEIAVWVDWLRSKGVKDVSLLGHSRGGAQAALYAATTPDALVGNLVLVASTVGDGSETIEGYRAATGRAIVDLLARAQKQIDDGDGDGFVEVPMFLSCRNARVTADAFLDYYNLDPARATPSLLAAVALPVLVVAAGRDEIVKDLPGALVRAGLPANVEVVIVDGADHFFRDLYVADLADAVARYLGRAARQ